MKVYILLVSAQTKRMQPISVSCEAPFRSNLQKKHCSKKYKFSFLLYAGPLKIKTCFLRREARLMMALGSSVVLGLSPTSRLRPSIKINLPEKERKIIARVFRGYRQPTFFLDYRTFSRYRVFSQRF